MAAALPLKINTSGDWSQFQTGDFVAIANGGTNATTASGARTQLGLAIGSNIQAFSTRLTNIAGVATAGLISLDASGNANMRSLTGTSGRTVVTNGDGVAGAPTVDLATVGTAQTSGLYKFAIDVYGRVTAVTVVGTADLTALLNGTYAPLASPTFTGTVTIPTPVNSTDAATKAYVDSLASGTARLVANYATTAALPSCTYNNGTAGVGATLTGGAVGALPAQDGQAITVGDTLLVHNQAAGLQNGLYTVTTIGDGATAFVLTRVAGMDQSGEIGGSLVVVETGTVQAGALYMATPNGPTIGTTAIAFTELNKGTDLTAGNGINIAGGTVSVVSVNAARIAVGGTGIDLATTGVSAGTYTKLTVDSYGRVTVGATATPSDIGAQPSSSELTAVAALATTGLLARTGTGTYSPVTIAGTAGRVTVTNGDGVAGAPTVDLATVGGLTPGTYNSVTVDAYGRVTGGTATSPASNTSQYANGEATSVAFGMPVYLSSGSTAMKAVNNSATAKNVLALVADSSINAAATGNYCTNGELVAGSTSQWDTITGGTGGLTPGSVYYLDATAGHLTTTPPSTGYLAPVGVATSTLKMQVRIRPPVTL